MSKSKDTCPSIKPIFWFYSKSDYTKWPLSLLLEVQFQFWNMILKEDIHSLFSCFDNFLIKSLDHGEIAMRTHLWFAANLFSSLLQQNLFHREVTWHIWPAPIGSSCVHIWPKAGGNQSILSRFSNEAFHLAPLWANMVHNFQDF